MDVLNLNSMINHSHELRIEIQMLIKNIVTMYFRYFFNCYENHLRGKCISIY